jgi:beta-glucosidase
MKKFTVFYLLFSILGGLLSIQAQKYTDLTAETSDNQQPVIVFDGNTTAGFWQDSNNEDAAWIIVDLGAVKEVGAVKIYWEAANAKSYNISFSEDNVNFFGQIDYTEMPAGNRTDNINGLGVSCRYIKIQGVERQLLYGYAIFEIEVFPPLTPELAALTVTPQNGVVSLNNDLQFTATGLDQLGDPIALPDPVIWTVGETEANINESGIFSASSPGEFSVTATSGGFSNTVNVEVLPENENLAIGKTASASSGNASLAVDDNVGSRWESEAGVDPQWLMVDLGDVYQVSDMIILWETANASNYTVEISNDATNWSPVITNTEMAEGPRTDRMYGVDVTGRYVRITGSERNTQYGYSIFEWKIFGSTTSAVLVNNIEVNGEGGLSAITENGGTLQMTAAILPENATDQSVTWSVDDESVVTISESGLLTALTNGTVTVIATANDGSQVSGSLEVTVSNQTVTMLTDNVAGEVYCYPNPISSYMKIPGIEKTARVTFFNMTGQIVKEVKTYMPGQSVMVSDLPEGIYFVKIKTAENTILVQKVIKQY